MNLLGSQRYVEVVAGRGVRVIANRVPAIEPRRPAEAVEPEQEQRPRADTPPPDVPASRNDSPSARQLLDMEVRHGAEVLARLTAEANPRDPDELRELHLDALRRRGRDEATAHEYELDLRSVADPSLLTTFVLSRRR